MSDVLTEENAEEQGLIGTIVNLRAENARLTAALHAADAAMCRAHFYADGEAAAILLSAIEDLQEVLYYALASPEVAASAATGEKQDG